MTVRPLRSILSFQATLVAVLPFLVAALLGFSWLFPQMRSEFNDRQLQLARAIGSQVESYLTSNLITVKMTAALTFDKQMAWPEIQQVLNAQIRASDSLRAVYAVAPSGRVMAVGLPPRFAGQRQDYLGLDLSYNTLFREILQGEQQIWSDTFLSMIGGGLSVALAVPTEKMVVIGEVDLHRLTEFLKRLASDQEQLIFLIDRRGQVIADQDGRYTAQQLNLTNIPFLSHGLTSTMPVSGNFQFNGRAMTGCLMHTPGIDWHVLVALPTDVAFRSVWTSTRIVIVGLLTALLLGVTLSLYMSRRLARRFETLTGHARRVAAGEEASDWPKDNITEFNHLATDLDRMAGAIRERQWQLRKLNADLELRVAERTAELAAANEALREEVGQRAHAQEEINLLNEDLLLQRNALETANCELESFSYSVSHDLRAPLRHLIGFSSALLADYRDRLDGTARDYLTRIARASRKMEELIDALLQLSTVSRLKLKISTVDLSILAREIASSLQRSAPDRHVTFLIAERLTVQADEVLLRSMVDNLLGNAWKYTSKKEDATIEFAATEQDAQTVYFIRDNGAGFDMAYADKLFSAFQRLHRESDFEGTGIGLATVQRIVTRHGGAIWAEGSVGVGATFYFTFPQHNGG
jgi:signal transduction histidine kinase